MTKDVLLSISGLHYDVAGVTEEDENEPIEVITPAAYYFKNGKHYVIYDEVVEGMPGTIKNKIRIAEDGKLEIMKSGPPPDVVITDIRMPAMNGVALVEKIREKYPETPIFFQRLRRF